MLIKTITKTDKLTKRAENIFDQREADEEYRKKQEANLKIIREAPKFIKTDFWCKKHGDTSGMAYKVVFSDLGQLKAYYESLGYGFPKEELACDKGLRRRITDKNSDPYYQESEMISKQAKEAQDKGYFLQPGQEGFIAKYGDPNKKKWEKMEQEERLKYEQQRK